MLNRITHTFVHVLDQDEALDFYVGKLGMVVHTDADLGFMRWLTVSPPEQPDFELGLMLPGPPVYDDSTVEQIRELVSKGAAGGGVIFETEDCQSHLRAAARGRRRVHPGADHSLLRHRLRAARPVRQPHPDHAAARRTDRGPVR